MCVCLGGGKSLASAEDADVSTVWLRQLTRRCVASLGRALLGRLAFDRTRTALVKHHAKGLGFWGVEEIGSKGVRHKRQTPISKPKPCSEMLTTGRGVGWLGV